MCNAGKTTHLTRVSLSGTYYPVGTTGTVPRAYDIFRPTKEWKGEFNTKFKFRNTFFFQKPESHYKPTCEVESV
jgi:hypothetical protein